jgi:flagellar basal body-associated protein FliL
MSAAKEEHKEEPKAEGAASSAPKSRVGVLVGAAVVILGLQAGMTIGVMKYLTPKEKHKAPALEDTTEVEEEEEEQEKGEPEMWEKPISKTVTIAGSGAKRYLKATFYLEYDKKKFPKFPADMEKEAPRAEFIINQVLSVIPFEEVSNPETQKKVCEEILVNLNKALPKKKLRVKEVLVTDWLLQ